MTDSTDNALSDISGPLEGSGAMETQSLNLESLKESMNNNNKDNDENIESSLTKRPKNIFNFGNKFGSSISKKNSSSAAAAPATDNTITSSQITTSTQKKGYLSFLYTMNDVAWEVVLFKRPALSVSLIAMIAFIVMTSFYPLIHCIVLLLLLALCVSSALALVKILLTAIAGKPSVHPYKSWITQSTTDIDLTVLEKYVQDIIHSIGPLLSGVIKLVLFYDLRHSIIVIVLLYALTYVTLYITLPYVIIVHALVVFVVPKLYSKTQIQVDSVISKISARYQIITDKIEKVVDTNS